ncbi:branched-chain amino acid ABC transporter permease [Methylobacterium terricola]|uniref:Branched-chain amino acid ABC transporter permease n=1 Tax=Methylobacterium terricola TaxID=2583531 RepID=A0A5C4LDZ6_9HYPH|nr:branched-chain amino acid ABC transporter permease [Methylobacterium terricola]TNC10307.1 branched-chain amino acid ABC transporter permease [Methylobacterium terricola]
MDIAMRLLARHQTPLLLILGLGLIAALSLVGGDAVQVTLTEMFIRVVVVVGLFVFIGNSGIISFGQVGFMCIGAYAAAWATAEPSFKQIMLQGLPAVLQENQLPFWAAILGAILLPAIVAFGLGLAIMRLSGTAASIATFAFLIIVNSVYANWDSVTAGVSSIVGIPTLVGPWTAYAFAGLAILAAYGFQVSRVGLMLRASRDDEVAARACAVKVVRMRLVAFVLSAAITGMGGGLYAQFLGILTVDPFYLSLSFITIAMLVVGGQASLTGAVAGVVAVTAVVELLRLLERGITVGGTTLALPAGSQEIGLGLVMALILIFRPNGLSRGRELVLPSARHAPTAPAGLSPRPKAAS